MTMQRLRKFLPFAPSLVLLIVIGLPAFSGAQQTCQPDGDVDRNGSVTAADALLAFQQALSLAPLNTCQLSIANVFPLPTAPDDIITASDALCIFQKALGLPSCLDVLPPPGIMSEKFTLPSDHGLAAGQFTLQPGAAEAHGNVVLSCPAGSSACVITVQQDGTATYDKTGGMPAVVLSRPEEFPALTPQLAADAAQAPIVDLEGTLHVGSDVAPSADQLTAVATHNGIAVSHGQVLDGAGAEEVVAYLNQQIDLETQPPGFHPFATQPTVRLTETAGGELTDPTLRAIQMINAALPRESRILFSSDPAPPRTPLRIPWGDVPDGQIFVDFSSPENPHHHPGTAYSQTRGANRIQSYVLVNPDKTIHTIELETQAVRERREQSEARLGERLIQHREEYEDYLDEQDFSEAFESQIRREYEEQLTEWYEGELERFREFYDGQIQSFIEQYKNYTLYVLVHEFIHAIGMNGHSDPTRFPHSVMHAVYSGDSQEHVLFAVDREALLAAYSVLEPGASAAQIVEDLGPWDDTSMHLRGDIGISGGAVAFGVASRNGLAQPWAFGPTPWTDLADNPLLSETITWSGRLLGFTPSVEAVGGAADLAVELGTLDGHLDFTNLEHWGANLAPGPVGSGTAWGDGALQYRVNVRGNTFVQTGGDDGTVTGAFFGATHEAMGGVLERTDLTAGFGGTR